MSHRAATVVPPVYYARELILDFITLFLIQAYDGGDDETALTPDLCSDIDNTATRQCRACDNELSPGWKRCPFCFD